MQKNTAVILARVSSKTQEDGYSLESQLKLLRGYCETKNYFVKKEFRIAETASKAQERTIFNQLLKYLVEEGVYHLIVEKTDRFTRNLKDAVAIDDWMQADADRYLHAVKENLLVYKDAKSDVKFMWNIHLAVAKKYTDNLREEAMKGWAEKLAQGWMPSPPPAGYMTAMRDGKKIHVLDPKTANGVRQVFKLYLKDGQCVRTIGERMTKMGITTKRNRPFSKSNVHKMLTNPYYMGTIRFDGKEYPGAHEPLITEELFDAVQAKLNNKAPKQVVKHDHALKAMLTCVYCDRIITFQKQKGHLYGACQRKFKDCRKKKFVREDKVQDEIQKHLSELVCPSNEVMAWVVDMLNNEFDEISSNHEGTIESINLEINRTKRMDEMLYDDKLSGEITPDKYLVKHNEFDARIAQLRKDLMEFDEVSKEKHEEAISIVKLSQQAAVIYSQMEDVYEKRNILTKLFGKMVVHDDFVSVTYTKFVKVIAQCSAESRRIMQTLKVPNQTTKKDPNYIGNLGQSEQEMLLRSVWCG